MAKIWLVGMMGSGKSTVAPMVGGMLGWQVVDTDAAIEADVGRAVPEWFSADLAAFRAAERAVILQAAARADDLVVACGGGAVLDAESVAAMRANGMVVFLEAPVGVLEVRVGSGDGRPLLDAGASQSLAAILAERIDLYHAASHAVVPAGEPPQEVAELVVGAWQNWS